MPETTTLPLDSSCRAQYADGFILDETEFDDKWPVPREVEVEDFDANGIVTGTHTELVHDNILRAILNKEPEAEHGAMVMFTVFWKDQRFDISWEGLPDNARPIRFRDGNRSLNTGTGEEKFWWSACRIGYQYTNENGENVKEMQEL